MLGRYLSEWKAPTLACLDEICEICESVGIKIATRAVKHFPNLQEHVIEVVIQWVSKAREMTKQNLLIAVDREIQEPYTQNHYYGHGQSTSTREIFERIRRISYFKGSAIIISKCEWENDCD